MSRYTEKDMTPITYDIRITMEDLSNLLDQMAMYGKTYTSDDIKKFAKEFIEKHKIKWVE